MHIIIDHPQDNPVDMLRRLGYIFQKRSGEEIAFIRAFSQSGFPRFHIYAKQESQSLLLHIHFDQHKETYGKKSAIHHGEYGEDGVLKDEAKRIRLALGIK